MKRFAITVVDFKNMITIPSFINPTLTIMYDIERIENKVLFFLWGRGGEHTRRRMMNAAVIDLADK